MGVYQYHGPWVCAVYIGIVEQMLSKPVGKVGQQSFDINLNQGQGLPSQTKCLMLSHQRYQSLSIPGTCGTLKL